MSWVDGLTVRVLAGVLIITTLSSMGDAFGFIHASRMWDDGRIVWGELARSAAGFGVSMFTYWVSVRFLIEAGVSEPEVQVLFWLTITVVGVTVLSGELWSWPWLDRIVAMWVVIGIGFLMFRR